METFEELIVLMFIGLGVVVFLEIKHYIEFKKQKKKHEELINKR